MSDPFNHQPFPHAALLALGGLILFSLLAVILAQINDVKVGVSAPSAVTVHRDLRFVDDGGGAVSIQDAKNGSLLLTLPPGKDNFIRGVMRSMARERRSLGVGTQTPFRLARHTNGQLTLTDLATQRQIELNAFGATNVTAFARLFPNRTTDS